MRLFTLEMSGKMGTVPCSQMFDSSLRFSSHELHVFACYDRLRRSGKKKTMLSSDVLQDLNNMQDPRDRAANGSITGADIRFITDNFDELYKCRSMTVLQPENPPPKLMAATANATATEDAPQSPQLTKRDLSMPPPRPKKRRRPPSPLSSALNKMRRNGYLCRSRFAGEVPNTGNHVLLTRQEQDKWRSSGETTISFRGDLSILKKHLGSTVEATDEEPGRVSLKRKAEVEIAPPQTLAPAVRGDSASSAEAGALSPTGVSDRPDQTSFEPPTMNDDSAQSLPHSPDEPLEA